LPLSLLPTTRPKYRHFDRSVSQIHREPRNAETRRGLLS
jgi:hypothetical protein